MQVTNLGASAIIIVPSYSETDDKGDARVSDLASTGMELSTHRRGPTYLWNTINNDETRQLFNFCHKYIQQTYEHFCDYIGSMNSLLMYMDGVANDWVCLMMSKEAQNQLNIMKEKHHIQAWEIPSLLTIVYSCLSKPRVFLKC